MYIVSVISNVGFPIACVLGCAYFIYKSWQANNEISKEREDKLFNQLDKFGDTMTALNTTLVSIDKRLTILEERVKTDD